MINLDKEFTLLINEKGDFELVECRQIINVAGGDKNIRAFIFVLNNKTWVKYWHSTGNGILSIQCENSKIELYKNSWQKVEGLKNEKSAVTFPVDNIRYLKFNLPEKEVVKLLQKAQLTE